MQESSFAPDTDPPRQLTQLGTHLLMRARDLAADLEQFEREVGVLRMDFGIVPWESTFRRARSVLDWRTERLFCDFTRGGAAIYR